MLEAVQLAAAELAQGPGDHDGAAPAAALDDPARAALELGEDDLERRGSDQRPGSDRRVAGGRTRRKHLGEGTIRGPIVDPGAPRLGRAD